MTFANMVDTDSYRQNKRIAKNKLHIYLTTLKDLKYSQVAQKDEMNQVFFQLLSSSDEKQQKLALDCLIKSGKTLLSLYIKPL